MSVQARGADMGGWQRAADVLLPLSAPHSPLSIKPLGLVEYVPTWQAMQAFTAARDENTPDEELKQVIRDTSIAVTHILLAATELALGTCWVAWFTQAAIRPILNIPEDKYVVGILTLGYAAEEPAARPRKNIEDVLHYDLW